MHKMMSEILAYYDKEVIMMIMEKYNMSFADAADSFMMSQTHNMLEDVRYGMDEFGFPGIFDIWECERITGDPRNSVYIRGE